MQLIKKRRVHRLVVVEGEVSHPPFLLSILLISVQEEERKGGKKGRLLGIITLTDVLRYIVGEVGMIAESIEPGLDGDEP